MNTELTIYVSLHVYLLLAAAVMFYGMLLNLLARRGTNKHALLWKALVGVTSVIISWAIAKKLLDGYFIGEMGFITDPSVTSLIPTLVMTREILLPLLIAISVIMVVLIYTKGSSINEYSKLKMTLILLASLSFILASALTFFGILVP